MAILGLAVLTLVAVLRPTHAATPQAARTIRTAHAPALATKKLSTTAKASTARPLLAVHPSSFNTQPILAQIHADLDSVQGSYGVEVIDCTTGEGYGLNAQKRFTAASVNKLPILLTLYDQAGAGKLDLDQSITITDDEIQNYGTGTIQEPNAPRTYTLRELGALMIEVSDNTAAYVLKNLLGEATIQSNAERWGLTDTSMANDTSTPEDAAILLVHLYRHDILSAEASEVAITLLSHTVFTNRLQAGVPSSVTVAHKTGDDPGVFNDAGLILAAQRPYAIAVFSNDATEDEADQTISKISHDVYAFETSLSGAAGH